MIHCDYSSEQNASSRKDNVTEILSETKNQEVVGASKSEETLKSICEGYKMNSAKIFNNDDSSEENSSSKKGNVTENVSEIKNQEVVGASKSDEKPKNICEEYKMNNANIFNNDDSSEQNASSRKDNVTEILSETKNQEIVGVSNSEEQLKDIFEETEKYIREDQQTKTEEEMNQRTERIEGNSVFISINRKRRNTDDETVLSRNPVKVQRNIKCGQVEKDGKPKRISLRRRVLISMTQKKCLPEMKKCPESTFKSVESESNFQKLQDKIPKISNKEKKKRRSNNLGGIDINPLSLRINKFQTSFQDLQCKKSRISDERVEETRNDINGNIYTNASFVESDEETSSNKLKEVWTNENQPTIAIQSTITPFGLILTRSLNVRSGIQVWEHFKKFLHRNKESLDRIVTDDTGRDDLEASSYVYYNSYHTRERAREITDPNFGEHVKTCSNCEISENHDDNLMEVLEIVDGIRTSLVKEITPLEKLLMSFRLDSLQEMNWKKKVKFLYEAENARKNLHKIFDILSNHEKILKVVKRQLLDSHNHLYSLFDITNLIELPLLARNIRTFFSLLLYQYKSWYYEVPMENVYKSINLNELVSAYSRYRRFKVIQECEKAKAENEVNNILDNFNVHLEQCLLIFQDEFLYFENDSFTDDQDFIDNMNLAIKYGLNCLNNLVSTASSLVFPIAFYLNESRKLNYREFKFLDKKLDAFSLLAKEC